jgi:putative ATPase
MIEGGEDVNLLQEECLFYLVKISAMQIQLHLLWPITHFKQVATIGYPESRIYTQPMRYILGYINKSNSSYLAIGTAQQLVKQTGNLSVPIHLRNAPTKLMKKGGMAKTTSIHMITKIILQIKNTYPMS